LKRLEEDGRIRSEGTGKGKRYFPLSGSRPAYEPRAMPPVVVREAGGSDTGGILLGDAAREIREIVRSPIGARMPVGYDPEFLGGYVPNQSRYLSEETCAELAGIGEVGLSELPAGTYVRQVLDRLMIDLSWNSSRLEGNTYSLLETERLLERGEDADGRGVEETQMILNHKGAIEMLAEQAEEIGFDRYTICNLHAVLSHNLMRDREASGQLRSRPVGIGGTVYHPLQVPQLVEERFSEILEKAEAIEDPYEQAFFAMVHLPYLQPFEDVNKRVSRLAANIPMVRQNLCPLSFIDVPREEYIGAVLGVYELKRTEYLRDVFVGAYQRSAVRFAAVVQGIGAPDPFRLRFRDAIGELVREVVHGGMDKREAARWIAKRAAGIGGDAERVRLIGVVERDLGSLHEGNIVPYRVRLGAFREWKAGWW